MKKIGIIILSILLLALPQIKAQYVTGYIYNKTPYDIFILLPYSSYSNTAVVKPGSSKHFYNDKTISLDFPPYVDTSEFAKRPVVNNVESGDYEVIFDRNKKEFAIKKITQSLKSAVIKK